MHLMLTKAAQLLQPPRALIQHLWRRRQHNVRLCRRLGQTVAIAPQVPMQTCMGAYAKPSHAVAAWGTAWRFHIDLQMTKAQCSWQSRHLRGGLGSGGGRLERWRLSPRSLSLSSSRGRLRWDLRSRERLPCRRFRSLQRAYIESGYYSGSKHNHGPYSQFGCGVPEDAPFTPVK